MRIVKLINMPKMYLLSFSLKNSNDIIFNVNINIKINIH